MSFIIGVLCILFFTLIGYSIITEFGFFIEYSVFEKLPFGFGLGVGMIAFQLFLYNLIHVPWNIYLITLPWFIFFFFSFRKIKIKFKKIEKLDKKEKLFFILIFALIVYVLFEAQIRPLLAWDGFSTWLLKAKVFYLDGFINPLIFKSLHDTYPYVINLASTFIYIALGKVDDRTVLILFYSFYFFLAIVFFTQLSNRINRLFSLIFTFLLISTQNLIRQGGRFDVGHVDLIFGFYFFLSSILLVRFVNNKSVKNLIILSIFLSITSLIKAESFPFTIAIELILFYILLKKKEYKKIAISLLYLVPFLSWQVFRYYSGMPLVTYYTSVFHYERIPEVIYLMIKEFINIKNWNLLWIFFIVLIPRAFILKNNRYLFFLIMFQLAVYFVVFLFSPAPPTIAVLGSIDRLYLHLAPLAVFISALSFFDFFKQIKIKN